MHFTGYEMLREKRNKEISRDFSRLIAKYERRRVGLTREGYKIAALFHERTNDATRLFLQKPPRPR